MLLLFGVFFLLLIFGAPVAFSMLGSSIIYLLVEGIPLEIAAQRMAAGPDSFPLLAVSFFILAGNIMNTGGITRRIFGFANHLVGHYTGGLAHSNVIASIIFSGMSGSAIADTGGLGAIEIQAMKEGGYDEDFSIAVTGASSIIGPIIPPSVPMVIFGVATGASIGRLFTGGILPGIILAASMMVLNYYFSKKRKYPIKSRSGFREMTIDFVKSAPALLTPVIIIGGIISGIFTPTEAAIVAVFYALIIGILYKEIHIRHLPKFLKETLHVTSGVLFILASASLFSWILTLTQMPQNLAEFFLRFAGNKYTALLIINIFLLCIGLFLDITPAILILVPVLLPIVSKLGIDIIHFGVVVVINLMIGLMTPPVGMILYVLSNLTKVPFERIAKSIVPYVLVCVVTLLLITYIPAIVTFIPNLIFGG